MHTYIRKKPNLLSKQTRAVRGIKVCNNSSFYYNESGLFDFEPLSHFPRQIAIEIYRYFFAHPRVSFWKTNNSFYCWVGFANPTETELPQYKCYNNLFINCFFTWGFFSLLFFYIYTVLLLNNTFLSQNCR